MKTLQGDGIIRHNPTATSFAEIDLREVNSTFYVYILASERHGMLSVSTTQDIAKRVGEQKRDLHPRDYTSVHGIHTLVHVQEFDDLYEAITCYNRLRKTDHDDLRRLVDEENPDWHDLYAECAP